MREDEPSTIDEATEPAIDESPFGEDGETTVEKAIPEAREDATVPTVTEPLPIGHGEEEEETTAVLGKFDPPTAVELHAPAVHPTVHGGPDRRRSVLLVGAVAVLTLMLAGCLVAVILL